MPGFLLPLLAAISVTPALAHEGQPVQVQIKEREPGSFLVQWKVPGVIPARAMPVPVLPESCRPEGERVLIEHAGGWLNRQVYRCPDGIAGQTIGIRYPVRNATITTILRVELLSGERFADATGFQPLCGLKETLQSVRS